MQKLNLPEYTFRFRTKGNKQEIFDEFRKKFLQLSPEEWVRQNFLKFLTQEKECPAGLISIEKALLLNNLKKRTDIVVYNKQGTPLLIVECKAPEIKITQKTFEQIARYNMNLKADYLAVTNGMSHYCCYIDHLKASFTFLNEIPGFYDMNK